MAPKKKMRLEKIPRASVINNDASDVHLFKKDLVQTIDKWFQMIRSTEECDFQSIVQKILPLHNPVEVAKQFLELLRNAGVLKDRDIEDECGDVESWLKRCHDLHWPPVANKMYEMPIIFFNLTDESTWWNGAPPESESIDIIRTIALTFMDKTKPLGFRMPLEYDPHVFDAQGSGFLNFFYFGEGQKRGLGCFVVLAAIMQKVNSEAVDCLVNPAVKDLIASLAFVPTVYQAYGDGSALDTSIQLAAKQNADAKAQPVSSFQWMCMLKPLGASVEVAVEKYQQSSVVQGYSGASSDGSDSVHLDDRKTKNVNNLLQKSTPEVHELMKDTQKHLPWKHHPWTEVSLSLPFLWIGSLDPEAGDRSKPHGSLDSYRQEGEPALALDWTLPLSAEAHTMLFQRWVRDYHKDTSIVPVESKKNIAKVKQTC